MGKSLAYKYQGVKDQMKVCPICKKSFADELNFCLDDGGLLVESESYNAEKTLAYSQDPTLQFPANRTNKENEIDTRIQPKERKILPYQNPPQDNFGKIVVIFLGIGFLLSLGIFGGYLYLRSITLVDYEPTPTPYYTPQPTVTPHWYPTPTPKAENNIKIEILEKTTDGFGKKYLKCKVTNISEKPVDFRGIGLSFYQNDVKITDSYSTHNDVTILKPNQTVPVWINLYGADKYTSVKVKEPLSVRAVNKPIEQIFPPLEFSQTGMKAERGYMSVNFRQYQTTYYKVGGIIENPTDEKISAQIVATFYDEKGEIVGFGKTSVSGLQKGEKAKFEIQETEADLFGKPKTFEVVAITE